MSRVLYINESRRDEIITDAAEKHTPVVLTRRGSAGWKVAKARFQGANQCHRYLLIGHPSGVDDRGWSAPAIGELLGVTFRKGHKKCLFNAVVVDVDAETAAAAQEPVFAVRWPGDVQELQRRVYQRACPPADRQIKVRAWSGGSVVAQVSNLCPPPVENRCYTIPSTGVIEDLSAGGIRFLCPSEPDWEPGQNVHIAFALRSRGGEVVVDGTFRHCEPKGDDGWSLGFQFVGLETSREGQELLSRIARTVTDFQRAHMRRRPAHLHSRW